MLWACIISDLNREETVWIFCHKELKKTNKKKIRVEKVIKRNGNKLYVKWKGSNSFLTVGLKKDMIEINKYFPEPKSPGGRVKIKLDSYNYVTKGNLKNEADIDIFKFAKKVELASLKSKVYISNID